MLPAGGERDIMVTLAEDPGRILSAVPARPLALLVTWEKGTDGFTAATSIATPSGPTGSAAGAFADALACLAEPDDALLASLPDALLGSSRDARNPVPTLAAILDALGSLRADRQPSGAAAVPGARAAARGLDPGEPAWAVLIASLGASLGVPTGLMSPGDRIFAVVDTGLDLTDAIRALPELAPYAEILGVLSRDGKLCVPVAGLAALSTAAEECAEALAFLWHRETAGAPVAWLDAARGNAAAPGRAPGRAPGPVLFPLVLPVSEPPRASWDLLRAQLALSLLSAR
jgi:hypothetical protein